MAQSRSGRGGAASTKSRNDTPNTPEVKESEIARLKVDELRRRLKDRGVKGTGELKKPDLVKRLIKVYVDDTKGGGSGKGGGSSKAGDSSNSKAGGSGKAGGGSADAKKSTKAADSGGGAKGAKVDEAGKADKGGKPGGIRTGAQTSRSLKYSQVITSTEEQAERPGRSLVTTDHDVIRQWAESRNAVPATVDGTEHGEHLGVLRFTFPGGDGGDRLRQVSWEEWLDTFDYRRLNFIYQEERSDGRPSTFFRLESPNREDA